MRLLLVEDDEILGDGLRTALQQAGYTVEWIRDGVEGLAAIESAEFAAIVLDLGLPGAGGLDVLRAMRRKGIATPVLILTARDTVHDRVEGLDSGGDDYLVKPFDVDELLARLRALLRRAAGRAAPLLEVDGLRLDPAAHVVTLGDSVVDLSPREFVILHELLENAGRVLSRDRLEESLYGWGDEIASNAVEVHIHHLRRKLGSDRIRTIRGVGYMIGGKEPES
jgi:DNA-binding response OmpR family regulator